MADPVIPWARPDFLGREREYVADALASTWISDGPYVTRLEQSIATYCDTPHAFAVANGTVALHLAYLTIGLERDDEIVVPGFGFLAAANVALHMGARPVFADVDSACWCLTASAIENVLTTKTRAVVATHTYGGACDMDGIMSLCRRHGIIVIEDAAESFATRYRDRMTGAIGDIGCFSFQATKTITTGEGGMVVTCHDEFVKSMQLYRSHGMLRTRYLHEVAGLNFRLTNIQAALGCAQFERLDSIISARRRMVAEYRECLAGEPGITFQNFGADVEPVVWAVALRLHPDAYPQGRDTVMEQFAQAGIETRPGFYTPGAMPHLYPSAEPVPICDEISRQVISVPSYPTLTRDEIGSVCDVLKSLRTGL